MAWNLEEALNWYGSQGAPSDQPALVSLLKEIQKEEGLTPRTVALTAQHYGIKETYLLAVIRRIPSLRMQNTHCLEICGGPNCSKRARLAAFAEKTWGKKPEGFELRYVGCMRMCGKGPNIRWDGKLYTGMDEKTLRALVENSK